MDENKYKFQKLTPVNDADISVYEEAIDFAFNNSDIKNIAISGAYSAGKSSVLESYKAKKPDKRFIHISLAHFRTPEYENSESETIIKESVLEGKILNQLIHQIQSNKIPQTNFRVKKGIDPKRLIFLTLFASLYLGSIAFLLLMSPIIDYITMLPEGWLKLVLSVFVNPYIQVIIAAITATCSVITIFSLIKAQKNKNLFRKISLQGNEIEIFEDQEDSYFDKYLNEVLYLFENVEADVIVFEDMDRFNASRIFERLREVNTLVNIHRTKENSDNKVTLKFFYLLRDDIFTTKDRTKFFDYIIPIVPVVDNSNSYEQFLKHLKTSNFIERFDQSFLQSLSLYIDDMRILKNIYNEFVVYIHRLNTTDLDWNKMMAVITYKNLFPRDFSDLQLSKGFLFTLFSQKPQLIETTLSDTKEKREVLRYRINCIKDEILISHQELDDAYLGKESRLPKSYGHLTNDGQKQKKANDLELKKRKQVVQDKLERILPELESQLAEIEQEIALIQTKSLQELITRYNENKFFSTTLTTEIDAKNDFKVIMESDYFDLLKFLIRNGHIDEKTYNDYLTYFYEDSISANDKTFLRRITDKRGAEYTYILKDPKKVIESPIIRAVEFDQVETLNFDLFHCLLRDDSDPIYAVYEKRLIEQIKRAKKFDFISNFYESGKSTSQFIIKINEIWPQFFLIALQEKAIPFNQIRQYSMDTLYYSSNDEIITVNEDNILSQYISNTPDYLNIENPVADRLIEGFSLIDVKFVTLDYELSNRKLFDAVYRNFLYILSFDNISLMIKQEYGFERDWDICHKNYTLIQSFPDSPLAKYISVNMPTYLEIVLTNCNGEICDDESISIKLLNNKDLESGEKKGYIGMLTTIISDISQILEPDIWPNVFDQQIVKYSVTNIINYFDKYGIDPKLIKFINSGSSKVDFTKTSAEFGDEIAKSFYHGILICNDIEITKYKQMLIDLGYSFDKFDADDISCDKLDVIINERILEMNEDGLKFIRVKYPEHLFLFIKRNLTEYLDLLNVEIFNIDEALEILKWSIDDKKKINLLAFTNEPISILEKQYSDNLTAYILKNNLEIADKRYLYETYSKFGKSTQHLILSFAKSKIGVSDIINKNIAVDDTLLSELYQTEDIEYNKKILLFTKSIPNLDESSLKIQLNQLSLSELNRIFEKQKGRRNYSISEAVTKVLEALKQHGWINDYRVDERNEEKYVVIKNGLRNPSKQ